MCTGSNLCRSAAGIALPLPKVSSPLAEDERDAQSLHPDRVPRPRASPARTPASPSCQPRLSAIGSRLSALGRPLRAGRLADLSLVGWPFPGGEAGPVLDGLQNKVALPVVWTLRACVRAGTWCACMCMSL